VIIYQWGAHQDRIRLGQISLLVVLTVLYGLQLANGTQLQASARDLSAVDNQGVLSIVFFLFASARAWQLVGARDTGLLSTVAEIAQRQARQGTHHMQGDQTREADPDNRHETG
jgi:hypothetical protein